MRRVFVLAALALAVAPVTAWAVGFQTRLVATVGPGFEIGLRTAEGGRVINLDPGLYEIDVSDQGDIHNFHLVGPGGVDDRTGLEFIGNSTLAVTLVNGSYRFFCDNHPEQMRGSFTVGTVAPPPPPPPPPTPPPGRLTASVGPGAAIALRRRAVKVRRVRAGRYVITVFDRSATDNFHLKGRGVNRKTGVAAKGKSVWRVTLRRGALYTFWSDAHRSLRGTVRAV
jgi:hypothetical protein